MFLYVPTSSHMYPSFPIFSTLFLYLRISTYIYPFSYIYLPTCLPTYLSSYVSICVFVCCLFIFFSIYLSIYLSVCLSVCLFVRCWFCFSRLFKGLLTKFGLTTMPGMPCLLRCLPSLCWRSYSCKHLDATAEQDLQNLQIETRMTPAARPLQLL